MKKFCESFSEHAMKMKKMKLLRNEQQESNENAEIVIFVKDHCLYPVRDHCHYPGEYREAANSTCTLKYIMKWYIYYQWIKFLIIILS